MSTGDIAHVLLWSSAAVMDNVWQRGEVPGDAMLPREPDLGCRSNDGCYGDRGKFLLIKGFLLQNIKDQRMKQTESRLNY